MRLVDKIKHEIQPYASRPSKFERAVGYLGQQIDYSAAKGDIYRVEYTIPMKNPEFNSTPFLHADRIGQLYAQERALLSFIAANGSFYCQDHRGPGYGPSLPPVLNEQNLEKYCIRYLKQEPMDYLNPNFISHFISWVKSDNDIDNRWFTDYPSYTFLHNMLCKFFGSRCHGMSHAGQSPSRLHNRTFTAKVLRKPEEIFERFQNFLLMKQAVLSQINRSRFNIIECQYGYKWRHPIKEWLLDVEIVYCVRFSDARNVLRASLESKFGESRGILDDSDCVPGLEGIVPMSSQSSKSSSDRSQGSDNLFRTPDKPTDDPTSDKDKSDHDGFESENDDDFVTEFNKTRTPVRETDQKSVPLSPKNTLQNVQKSEPIITNPSSSSKQVEKENELPGPSGIISIGENVKTRSQRTVKSSDSSQSPEPVKEKRPPARRVVKKNPPKLKATRSLKKDFEALDESKADEFGWIKTSAGEFTTPKLIRTSKRRRSTIGSPEASLTTKCKKDNYLF